MRKLLVVWVVAVVACKKEEARPPASASGAGTGSSAGSAVSASASGAGSARGSAAAMGDAGVAAAPVDVDLLYTTPSRVAVSSVVANPRYSPFDLFDDKLGTAWNSRTGDLVGAWIAFRVPPSTHVKEVRLTAGFATKGREGDYFTMNPRIAKVAIWHDRIKLREQALDVTKRDLQSVAVDATGGDYKLEVLAIVPGSKKSWREICVSELAVIGRPPPGMKISWHTPVLSVGSLDATPLTLDVIELTEPASYASVAAFCADYIARPPGLCEPWDRACEKTPEKNTCGEVPEKPRALPTLPAGWKGQWVLSKLGNSNMTVCNLVLEAKGQVYVLEAVGYPDCGAAIMVDPDRRTRTTRDDIAVSELLGDGGEPELSMYAAGPEAEDRGNFMGSAPHIEEKLHLCAAGTTGTPHCGSITVGSSEMKTYSGGEPGADGYDQWYEESFRRDVSIKSGVLDVKNAAGTPDELDSSVHRGRYLIRVIED